MKNIKNGIFGGIVALIMCGANAANVVARPTTASARPTAARTNNAETRMPTLMSQVISATTTLGNNNVAETTTATETTVNPTAVTTEETPVIIEDKTTQFDRILSANSNTQTDAASNALADMVRAQRAALDAASAINTRTATGANACDSGLRACMTEKCGANFTKCALDGDTTWGNKMENCRLRVKCTGAEYAALAPEIKADRDMHATISSYTEIVDCGNEYNNCIVTECGTTFNKCLGKSAGDNAIAKCKIIADRCRAMDSGLSARVSWVFGTLRQNAEKQIASDEKRLYELRDQMATQCKRLGAMFDERTLDCVFTVNFWANNSDTPYASQKRYAGDTFDCTQDWFGVDVTTFRENAYRLTRSQTAASSAMLGAGVGIAAGAISSGAINRAIDRTKAEKELKDACSDQGMKLDKKTGKCIDANGNTIETDENDATSTDDNDSSNATTSASSNRNAQVDITTLAQNGRSFLTNFHAANTNENSQYESSEKVDVKPTASQGGVQTNNLSTPEQRNEDNMIEQTEILDQNVSTQGSFDITDATMSDYAYFEFADNGQTRFHPMTLTARKGQFSIKFDNGVLLNGEVSCNDTKGDTVHRSTKPSNTFTSTNNGNNCWCRLTNTQYNDWFYVDFSDNPATTCGSACASECSQQIWDDDYHLHQFINAKIK